MSPNSTPWTRSLAGLMGARALNLRRHAHNMALADRLSRRALGSAETLWPKLFVIRALVLYQQGRVQHAVRWYRRALRGRWADGTVGSISQRGGALLAARPHGPAGLWATMSRVMSDAKPRIVGQ